MVHPFFQIVNPFCWRYCSLTMVTIAMLMGSQETKNEELSSQPGSNPPTESEHSDTNNNDTGSN